MRAEVTVAVDKDFSLDCRPKMKLYLAIFVHIKEWIFTEVFFGD